MKQKLIYRQKIWNYYNRLTAYSFLYRVKAIGYCCIVLLNFSCEDFVGVELPSSQLGTEVVFKDAASANAAMTGVYANIRDTGILSDLSYDMGLYSDELDLYGSGTTNAQGFYQNSLMPSDNKIGSWWNDTYSQIYDVNAIIEHVNGSNNLSEDLVNQLMGEALFIRGMLHFYLSQVYGEIPYITTTDYKDNTAVSKMAVVDIFTHVEADLSEAVSLLPGSYSTDDRTRANRAVAMAFLARVYLYNGKWEKAKQMAGSVLEQTDLYQWEENLESVFLKESSATLLQWYPKFEGNNTPEGRIFIFDSAPPDNVALASDLVKSFHPNDLRLTHWIRKISDTEESWYHSFKYKEKGSSDPVKEYSVMLRLAEIYLIRSEASVRLGDFDLALSDLNKVRTRAGLAAITTRAPKMLLELIGEERRHEFFTENGHRFFDLKRNNRLDRVLSGIKTGWVSTDQLLPLPERELVLNPQLEPQNPGY
ncbi:RagB/SusD family nutrient uptake outer membrane protein [Galbibacter sp. PAP.153]|uniref:RagB/SusD family nutrient uptake outer membrane protein n=1 Tax=Galbibacter sp. PAP.153 TaxID=3104623 RepID=UPI00300B1F50